MATSGLKVVILLVVVSWARAEDSKFRWRLQEYVKPWTKGVNMCAYYRVNTDKSERIFYSDCQLYRPKQMFTKDVSIEYECCYGFKEYPGEEGCIEVRNLEDLQQTSADLGLSSLGSIVIQSETSKVLSPPIGKEERTYTFFAPSNIGIRAASIKARSMLSDKRDSTIKYHLTNGRLNLRTLKADQLITSEYHDNNILISRYYEMTTANCAPVVRPAVPSTNGIIHVIDGVMEPIPKGRNILAQLRADDKGSEFRKIIQKFPDIVQFLNSQEFYTVFVPTNEAMQGLPYDIKETIDSNAFAMRQFVLHHIIKRSVCSTAILEPSQLQTMEGSKIKISVNAKEEVFLNDDIAIGDADKVTLNGVVHYIDRPLTPTSVMPSLYLTKNLGMTTFTDYVQQAGLERILMEDKNKTVFVPTEEAWANLTKYELSLLSRRSYLDSMIRYHMIDGEKLLTSSNDQELLKTQSRDASLTISYSRELGDDMGFHVQTAKVVRGDIKGSKVTVHVIDKVLLPPFYDIMAALRDEQRLRFFYDMLQRSGLENDIKEQKGRITIIAPTDEAFENIDAELADKLQDDAYLNRFMKLHVMNQAYFTGDFQTRYIYNVPSSLGQMVMVRKTRGVVSFNNHSEIIEGDRYTRDGVIHLVDQVLQCHLC